MRISITCHRFIDSLDDEWRVSLRDGNAIIDVGLFLDEPSAMEFFTKLDKVIEEGIETFEKLSEDPLESEW